MGQGKCKLRLVNDHGRARIKIKAQLGTRIWIFRTTHRPTVGVHLCKHWIPTWEYFEGSRKEDWHQLRTRLTWTRGGEKRSQMQRILGKCPFDG